MRGEGFAPALGLEVPLWLPFPARPVPYACPALASVIQDGKDGQRRPDKPHVYIQLKKTNTEPLLVPENHQNYRRKKKRRGQEGDGAFKWNQLTVMLSL